jgi:hypothetical protein
MPSTARIYDNGGKTADRYTLVVPSIDEPGKLDMWGFDENPYHPQGFGQYAGSYHKMGSYSHLGKLVSISDLPDKAQRFVKETLTTPLPDGYGMTLPKTITKERPKRKTGTRKSKSSPPSIRGIGR